MDSHEDQASRLARELSRATGASFEAAREHLTKLGASAGHGAEIAGGLRRLVSRYPRGLAWQRFTEPNRRRRRG